MTTAVTHLAGYGDLIPELLDRVQAQDRKLDARRLQHFFQLLLTGNAAAIAAAADKNGYALEAVAEPLILLGRAALLPRLHEDVLRQLGNRGKSPFTANAAVALAAGDEWDHALRILARAGERGEGIDIDPLKEERLWKYAYLHQRVESVMPMLAEIRFLPEFPELVEYRKWKLKAYQIRAGLSGDRVPVVEGEQSLGYSQAAAMQIAALADDPAAADYVAKLRATVTSRTISMRLAERGFPLWVTNVPQAFATAETQMAARRKDATRLETLARTPLEKAVLDPPTMAIDALLDERDWRTAAVIAQEHDPRRGPPSPSPDNHDEQHYASLYIHIAVAAAREGDDAAAAALLGRTRSTPGRSAKNAGPADDSLGIAFVLSVIAANRLPRKYLNVMFPALIVKKSQGVGIEFTRTPK